MERRFRAKSFENGLTRIGTNWSRPGFMEAKCKCMQLGEVRCKKVKFCTAGLVQKVQTTNGHSAGNRNRKTLEWFVEDEDRVKKMGGKKIIPDKPGQARTDSPEWRGVEAEDKRG